MILPYVHNAAEILKVKVLGHNQLGSVIPGPQKGYVEKVRFLNAENFGNGFGRLQWSFLFPWPLWRSDAGKVLLLPPSRRRGNERGGPVPRYFSKLMQN